MQVSTKQHLIKYLTNFAMVSKVWHCLCRGMVTSEDQLEPSSMFAQISEESFLHYWRIQLWEKLKKPP